MTPWTSEQPIPGLVACLPLWFAMAPAACPCMVGLIKATPGVGPEVLKHFSETFACLWKPAMCTFTDLTNFPQALEEADLESAALAQSMFQGIGAALTQPSTGSARAGLQVRRSLAACTAKLRRAHSTAGSCFSW